MSETKNITENYGNFVDFFQIPYNIFDRRFDDIQKELEENNIGLISRSTFLKGIIPCSIDEIPEGLEDIKPYKENLINLANNCELTVAELASIFVYYNDYINSTILGVNSPEELENNINSINKFDENLLANVDFDALRINEDYLIDPRKWDGF